MAESTTTATTQGREATAQPLKAIGSIPVVKPSIAKQHLKILVYGYPGVGKTVFTATANDDPRTRPALFIDFEGGTLSIAERDIDVVRVMGFKQFNEIYEFLRTQNHYKTVILDSITEIQKLNMLGLMADAVRLNPNKDPDRPLIDDWGKSTEQMRKLIRHFRDLPMHVIITALAQEVKDERDGSITVKPSLPGKLADEICGMLDIVGYLGVMERTVEGQRIATRQLLVQPMGKFIAKDRSDKLGQLIENPTIPKLLEAILPKN